MQEKVIQAVIHLLSIMLCYLLSFSLGFINRFVLFCNIDQNEAVRTRTFIKLTNICRIFVDIKVQHSRDLLVLCFTVADRASWEAKIPTEIKTGFNLQPWYGVKREAVIKAASLPLHLFVLTL